MSGHPTTTTTGTLGIPPPPPQPSASRNKTRHEAQEPHLDDPGTTPGSKLRGTWKACIGSNRNPKTPQIGNPRDLHRDPGRPQGLQKNLTRSPRGLQNGTSATGPREPGRILKDQRRTPKDLYNGPRDLREPSKSSGTKMDPRALKNGPERDQEDSHETSRMDLGKPTKPSKKAGELPAAIKNKDL